MFGNLSYDEAVSQSDRLRDAVALYRNDLRARHMVNAAVAFIHNEHGPVDPWEADRGANDIATKAALMMLAICYQDNAEVIRLRAERDQYKAVAEKFIMITPFSMVVPA